MSDTSGSGTVPMCSVCGERPCEPRYREGRDGRVPSRRASRWRRRCRACRAAGLDRHDGATTVGLDVGQHELERLMAHAGVSGVTALAKQLGVSRDVVRVRQTRGLTADEARDWAGRLGLDREVVWS